MENKKINIAELLKDCPKGMELYSPLCGKCVFDRLNFGTIICKKQNTQEITFTSQGHYMLPVFDDCECMIFPSKDQRDWSKFVPPCKFKGGDILSNGISISIHNGYEGEYHYGCYVAIGNIDLPNYFVDREDNKYVTKDDIRLATEEEKKKLFDAIKENGYRWSPETKILETLTPNKFDTTTLKPFDKVLVRDDVGHRWRAGFYRVGCASNYTIPYEGNEHLLGSTDDYNEYISKLDNIWNGQ